MKSTTFVHADADWHAAGPGLSRKILGYDETLMMVSARFDEGAAAPLHHHPHRQVTYVAAGRFEIEVDGVKQQLSAGDSFFVAPDVVHAATALQPGILIDVFSPARADFLK